MNLQLSLSKVKLFLHFACVTLFLSVVDCFADVIQTELHQVEIEEIATGLKHPWGLAFLPQGDMLVTERIGQLRLIKNGALQTEPVKGLPRIQQHGQGGLLDIALHPDFENNRLLYLAYAGKSKQGYNTEVLRARFTQEQLSDVTVIFRALPKSSGGRHFGGRLLFSNDGHLFISLGDRGDRPRAQLLNDHAGSLIRIHDDGSIPADNPFTNHTDALQEIYSYGHRNIQGITRHPESDDIWLHEHGPQGGDEINIVRPGANYGWPLITYGVNYVLGTKIGLGTQKEGLEQPLYHWTPSIAPSGMTFYTGDEFPAWRGQLFVGSLKFGLLVRLVLKEGEVIHEERMLNKAYGRVRDVRQGPNGHLYLLTDEKTGSVLRLNNGQ